ncbi:hypothetical protein CONPUDRAFT_82151 [Coniophora puteana RWD-64-598 SS2]|uniref:Uncharacterized protein n=1 Tax=Coniophora puteana (strain RWD-64-598) TaxID=741705 RepID=A0A5M3MPU9_CONPW|nr:uncharacterized protein CONPUDRAFT_82151 [Coniophora puteana RWD-64-598 SS2]EIW81086.1 hypothetical protein CONPUDRAFT_82151 [Coniophora puteana RWD-64-598 SS2]
MYHQYESKPEGVPMPLNNATSTEGGYKEGRRFGGVLIPHEHSSSANAGKRGTADSRVASVLNCYKQGDYI